MEQLNSSKIKNLQTQVIELWHTKEDLIHTWNDALRLLGTELQGSSKLVYDNQLINCFQWHQEDKSRTPNASDSILAQVKREIDSSNQRRVDKIEELDAYLVSRLVNKLGELDEHIPLNSETPGSIIDRLSILALKIYHMLQETKRPDAKADTISKCRKKLEILLAQQNDLGKSLDQLMQDLACGKRRLKVYYQFKMYNDPETNPAIYLSLT